MRHNQKKESRVIEHHENGKQTEEKLREYERVFEGLEEMIAVVDRDYRYLIANRAFLNQRGLKREKVVGHLISEGLDKDVFERVIKPKLEECFQGKVVRYEMDYSYPGIGERVLFVSYLPIEGPNGIDRVACVLQDITEYKQAEEALRQAEQKYRDIFENADEGIFQSTPEGRFLVANPALARMHGFDSPEDLIRSRDDISRQIYADSASREEFKRLLEEDGIVRGFEYQVFRKDGSKIWSSVNARAVRDEGGAILYYEGTAQDINERKRAEVRSAAFATLARKLSGAWTQLDAGRIIAQTAGDLFGWDSCNLDLYDAERDLVHHMLDVDTIGGKRTDFTAFLSDRKPTPREKRVIDHGPELRLREEPIQFDADAIPFGDKTRPSASMMTVPIRHAARVIGLLSIQSYTLHSYDSASLADLQAIADHCGEALNRIRAEEELRESEERYRDLVENSRELICTHDLDGLILSANRASVELLGYDPKDYCGKKSIRDILAPEVRHQFDEYMARLCKEGATSGIMLVQTMSGERRIWEYYNSLRTEGVATPIVRGMARDITDRKRAEAALRESEERLRLALDAAHMGTFDWDVPRNRTTWSRWHEELWGFKPGEFGGTYEAFSERVHHDDLPGINADIARCIASREPSVREFRVVWPDGSVHWMQSRGEFTFGDDGQPVRMLGVVVETTAQRLAEEALRTSEERLRVGLNTANIAVFNQDLDLRYIWMYQPQLGYTSEQVTGHTDAELLPPEAGRQVMEIKRRVLESGLKEHAEVPVSVGGQTFIYDLVVEPLRDANSAIIGLTGASLDITERKRAEAALQESEERFRQLSEAAFEAIILHDQGTILEVNQSFCRMYGYERAEVIGKSVLDLALPEFRELLLQRVRSGDTGLYEGLALRKDGTIFRAGLAGKPIHYQGRVVRVAAIRDITEQKRNERRQAAQYAVTRVLAESATLAEATPQLLQVICESLRWKMGECWRVCDSTNLLRCVETWHVPALDATSFIEASRQTELAPGVGLPGRVWQSGQPAWIPDVTTDPRFAHAAIAAKVGLRGAVAFPILLENHTLGVMQFFNRRTPEVDEELLKIMSAIGSQIGQFAERKRAEEALLASERKYRDIFAFAPVGIYQSLDDGTIITANHTLAEMLGYASVDELLRVKLGRDVYLVDGERERLIQEHEDRGYPVDLELQWKTKDGSPIWVQLTAHAIKGANGATEYWEGFVRDITERQRAEEALARTTHELSEFIEHATVGIHWVRLDGIVQLVNRAELEMLGYTREEYIGHHIAEFHADQPVIQDILDRLSRNETIQEYAARLRCKDGSIKDVLIDSSVLWEDGKFVHTRCFTRDITERKRAEEALRASEYLLRESQRIAGLGSYVLDIPTGLWRSSDVLDGMFGIDETYERSVEGWAALVHPDDRTMTVDYFRNEVLDQGLTFDKEYRIIRSNNQAEIWVHGLGELEFNDQGRPLKMHGTIQDITERKRVEEALLASERRYRDIFAFAPVGIYQSLRDGTLVTANKALAEMLGYDSVDELLRVKLGRDVYLVDGERERLIRKYEALVFATDFEIQWKRKDGAPIWVQLSAHAIKGANGATEYFEGFVRDVNDRKLAEAALRESEERYRELFENSKDAIYVHDLSGRYISVNCAAEKLSGYTREEILGKHFSNFVSPRDLKQVRTNLCRKLDEENETIYEVDLVTRAGRRVPVEVSSRLIYENGVAIGVQGTARDITDRKRAQDALRIYSQRLIQAQEAEREKIARELHDQIGQVLTAVRINLQSIQRSCRIEGCVPPLNESIGIVDEALGRVRELSIELRPSLLDDLGLPAALRWYVDRYAQRTGIIAEVLNDFEEDGRLPRELETVCFRIAQEALTNVARHAQAGSVSVQLERSRERMLLTIIDDGVGFDVDKLRKSAAAASALGLRGMEERALAVGGYLEIDSGPGRGTRVCATFPLKRK